MKCQNHLRYGENNQKRYIVKKINISCILLNTGTFVLCNFASESVENIFFHASSVPFGRDTQPKNLKSRILHILIGNV